MAFLLRPALVAVLTSLPADDVMAAQSTRVSRVLGNLYRQLFDCLIVGVESENRAATSGQTFAAGPADPAGPAAIASWSHESAIALARVVALSPAPLVASISEGATGDLARLVTALLPALTHANPAAPSALAVVPVLRCMTAVAAALALSPATAAASGAHEDGEDDDMSGIRAAPAATTYGTHSAWFRQKVRGRVGLALRRWLDSNYQSVRMAARSARNAWLQL
eukprot:gnl/Ergobibamus_cyprinoides/1919.p1 GENE.gnl/Ergobibamus_cyprinoides/1919~~gnl/Ergobibamus_cyprinoides/1919.p1  ORF type:complete len:224 (-),score=48.84 gnl/Ergobibamus_cyprinoides/1919:71-742(-)